MRLGFEFHPAAEEELAECSDYYFGVDPRFEGEFLDEAYGAIGQVCRNPKSCPLVIDAVRRKVLNKYPFSIFYIKRHNIILIVAIAHHKRRPFYWTDRIQ